MFLGNFGNTCVQRRGGSSIVFVCMIMTVICAYVGHETLASREGGESSIVFVCMIITVICVYVGYEEPFCSSGPGAYFALSVTLL